MADPLFGVDWKMNKASSLFSTSFNPDSETRRYEEIPNGYTLVVSGMQQGRPYSWKYTALYDGKDHPVTGRADADSIEAYRVNDKITIGFFKKNGIYSGPYARKISEDGKTLTVQSVGKNPNGQVFFDVIEYRS